VFGLAGCRHKTTLRPALPVGVLAPIELETIPPPDSLPTIATLPVPDLELPPEEPPKPAPRRRPAPKEEPEPPVQVASAPEPAALAIGTLSTEGDAAPQTQQQAQGLIASILKRIAALSAKTDAQKKQIRQIRNFIDQAQKALNSGDAEGARNLATKASLLMDDLEKK
jgi:outer membrane biosynthesis protein TonB